MQFNGSTDFLACPTNFSGLSAGASVFIVTNPSTISTNSRFFDFGNGAANNNLWLSETAPNGASLYVYNGTTASNLTSTGALTANVYQLLEAFQNGASSASIYTNGILGASGTTQNLANVSRTANLIGTDNGKTLFFTGTIAEILIYQNQLSASDRQAVESYLSTRYSLAPPVPSPPAISPKNKVFSTTPQTVTITVAAGQTAMYTLDGSTPTPTHGTAYSAAFSVSTSTIVQAIAISGTQSSSVSTSYIQFDSSTANLPQSNLQLWLKGDYGIQLAGGNSVGSWIDMSGSGNNASQTSSGNQPTLSSNAVNSLPAISFDGSNDFLSCPAGFAALNSGASVFVVTKPSNINTGARFVDFGNGSASDNIYLSASNPSGASLFVYNGSTASSVTSANALTTSFYQLLEAIQNGASSASIWTNGIAGATGATNNPNNVTRNSNLIGTDFAKSLFFGGGIAEILIYQSPLSGADRQSVENYLITRYNLVAPAAPTISPSDQVFSTTPQTVSIAVGSGQTAIYTLDESTPTPTHGTTYTGPFSISTSSVVKAIAVNGSQISSVATSYIQFDSNTANVPRSNLQLWLKGDYGVQTSSGTNVGTWIDMSGSGNNASQSSSGNQPTLMSSAVNNLPGLSFDGSNDYLMCAPGFASLNPGASIFVVTKPNAITSGARFLDFGNGSASDNIYLSATSPTGASLFTYNGTSPSSVTSTNALSTSAYQLLEAIQNGAGSSTIWTNGVSGNTASTNNLNNITRSGNFIGTDYAKSLFLNGTIVEIILYQTPLNSSDRQAVENYLIGKYNLVAPSAPSISPLNQVFAAPQTVTITAAAGTSIFYSTTGTPPTPGTGTSYTSPFTLNNSATVQAIAVNGSETSAVSTSYIQIDAATANVPRTNLSLWLKGDFGTVSNGNALQRWIDMSGNANDATQNTSGSQPVVSTSAINGLPAITFNGASSYMQCPSGFSNFGSGATAFMVCKFTDVTSGGHIFDFGNGENSDNFYGAGANPTSIAFTTLNGSTPTSLTQTNAFTLGQPVALAINQNGAASGNIFVNGSSTQVGALSNLNTITRSTNLIGADFNHSLFYNGQIAELLLFNASLNSSQMQSVNSYLLARYGIFVTPTILKLHLHLPRIAPNAF